MTRPNRRQLGLLMLIGLLVLLVSASAGYAYAYRGRMAPRTRISGIPVGHLTPAEAEVAVTAHQNAFLDSDVQLDYVGASLSVKPKQLGIQFETVPAIGQAYGNADRQPWPTRLYQLLQAPLHPRNVPAVLSPISPQGDLYLTQLLAAHVEEQATETTLSFVPGNVTVKSGQAGHSVDRSVLNRDLAAAYAMETRRVSLAVITVQPQVAPEGAAAAALKAGELLKAPWTAQAGSKTLTVSDQDLATVLRTAVIPATAGLPASLALRSDPAAVQSLVAALAQQADRPAQNAMLGMLNGSAAVTQPDIDGLAIDQAAAAATIEGAIVAPSDDRKLTLATSVTKAAIRADTLASAGVSQLIGSATTDFVGSPINRVWNIGQGQRSLNGILIADGKEFSTLDGLGPIDGVHGYRPELSIVNNRTVLEDGGGLCQVSTTLFRSALSAGLPITERYNHAYRVGYYEVGVGPGLDATIYSPAPDFKWKNDTGHPIYVQSHIVGTKLTFELFGTSDGRTAAVSAPTIVSESPPGDPIYANTDTLPKGTTKQTEHPHPGAVTTVSYTVTRGGQAVNSQTFRSTYRPWPAQYLVGTS